MRSRAEWLLRGVVLAALVALLLSTMRAPNPGAGAVIAESGLEATLRDATRRDLHALQLRLDTVPGRMHRDWLAAVRSSGTDVTWQSDGLRPIAIAAATVPVPQRRIRVSVAASDTTRVVLSDGLGVFDTLTVADSPSSTILRTATGALAATGEGIRAVAAEPAPLAMRRVLVLASAGWESKFVVAALEEAGWTVDARIRVAPGVDTRQGASASLDTARYAAVIALDATAAANASDVTQFVSSGGGAILAGSATRSAAFARVAPAVVGARRTAEPRRGLLLVGVKADAVVLEVQGGAPLVAARRWGRGRMLTTGYDETWRWRMSPAPDAAAEHREWWNALVSAVAYAPGAAARDTTEMDDRAPFAALTAVLGPPSEPRLTNASRQWTPPLWLLFAGLLGSLLGEVFSRRLRGLT